MMSALSVGQVQVADRLHEEQDEDDRRSARRRAGGRSGRGRSSAASCASGPRGRLRRRLAGLAQDALPARSVVSSSSVRCSRQCLEALAPPVADLAEDVRAALASRWTRTTRRSSSAWRRSTSRASPSGRRSRSRSPPTRRAPRRAGSSAEARRLQDRQDVEVDEAERAAQPAPERGLALARVPDRQLVEQRRRACGGGRSLAIIQCHIDNLGHL